MTAPQNSYWSVDACAWVRCPGAEPEVDLPAQRPAEQADEAVDVEADLPSGAPV